MKGEVIVMSDSKETALTTIDNPYSPFSQFDDWYNYDTEKGYDCCGYLDRVLTLNNVQTSYLNEDEESKKIDEAIDQIVTIDPTGMFAKVEKLETKQNGRDFKVIKANKELV